MVFPYKWYLNPFAVSGDLTAVPNGVQPDGSISYAQGWGPNYALDPSTNPSALNVDRRTTNELFYDITQWAQYTQTGLPQAFIDSATNGGSAYAYAVGARVLYTDANSRTAIYENAVAANTSVPVFGGGNGWAQIRTKLTANATIYASDTGSDSTGNGASGTPFATMQKAIGFAQTVLDTNGYILTLKWNAASAANTESIIIGGQQIGVSDPANLVLDFNSKSSTPAGAGDNITCRYGAMCSVQNVTLTNTHGGSALTATANGQIVVGSGVTFGSCTGGNHMVAQVHGRIGILGNYTISGGAAAHFNANDNGVVLLANGSTTTLSGTPAFATAFVFCNSSGFVGGTSVTYSGSATGVRYSCSLNGVIFTNSGGASYFPGNAAGTTGTGGQYN